MHGEPRIWLQSYCSSLTGASHIFTCINQTPDGAAEPFGQMNVLVPGGLFHSPGRKGARTFYGVHVMMTRSRIALLSACSAVALSLAALTPTYAAEAPAAAPAAATQHNAKQATKHHVKAHKTSKHRKSVKKHTTTTK